MKFVVPLLLLLALPFSHVSANTLGEALAAVKSLQDLDQASHVVARFSDTLEEWEQAIVYTSLGWKLNAEERYRQAEKAFRRGRKLSGKHYEVIGIAIAQFNQKKYKRSLKTIQSMLKRDEKHPVPKSYKESANYILGINYQELNKLRLACIHWDRAYRLTIRKSDLDSHGMKSYKLIQQHCKS